MMLTFVPSMEEQTTLEDIDLQIDRQIEALLFAADHALSRADITKTLEYSFDTSFEAAVIDECIEMVRQKYAEDSISIQLVEIAGGFTFMTKPEYHKIIGDYLKLNEKKKLSRAALETLAIIAYKQPITKSGIESIRGVNSDYSVQKLLDKGMVEIAGRQEGPGRPLLYRTSKKFLNHFGLRDFGDLPKLKEITPTDNQIGNEEE